MKGGEGEEWRGGGVERGRIEEGRSEEGKE